MALQQQSETVIPTPEPPAPNPRPPALGATESLRWVWRQLTSMRTALILLFLLAVAAMPGSLIPQTRVDPSAVVAWKNQHPSLAPVFDRLDLFAVYSSPWFSAIYLLLVVSLVGCFVPRIRQYAKAVRTQPPRAPRNLSRLPAYATWVSDEPVAEQVARAQTVLRGQRLTVYETPEETVVSAERGRLREAANLLFHVSVLVVLLGVAATGLFGFKGDVAVVSGQGFSDSLIQYDDFTPGAYYNSANLPPFAFRVKAFHVSWDRSGPGAGTPLTFNADLAVTDQPGAKPYMYKLQVNHPLQVDGVAVYLVGHGYAPNVTVRDGTGHVAFSGPVIFLPQDGSFVSYGVVKAPDATPSQLGFEGYFYPTAAITPQGQPFSAFPAPQNPVLSLVGYHGNLGLDDGIPQSVYVLQKSGLKPFTTSPGKVRPLLLKPGQTVRLGGGHGSITFNGYTTWVKLQINRAPAKVVPLTGVLLAILGLLGSLFIRPRRTWVRARRAAGRTVIEVAALDRVAGGDPAAHVADVVDALRRPTSPGSAPGTSDTGPPPEKPGRVLKE